MGDRLSDVVECAADRAQRFQHLLADVIALDQVSVVRAAGLLSPRPGYYAWKITLNLALTFGCWAAFFVVGDSWWQLPVAVALSLRAESGRTGWLAASACTVRARPDRSAAGVDARYALREARRFVGLPYALVFQVMVGLFGPIVDVAALYGLLTGQGGAIAVAWLGFTGSITVSKS